MAKRILVTCDLSSESESAFDYAKKLADQESNSEIIVLSVLEDLAKTSVQFVVGFTLFDFEGAYERFFKEVSNELKGKVEEKFAGYTASAVVVPAQGSVSQSIINFIGTDNIDILVMATHGRTGVRHLVLGSVTEKVIREANIPVLVVPAEDSQTTEK